MAWYDKYTSGQSGAWGQQYTPEEALEIRRMEFAQRMAERKATDKYDRKQARRDRIRNRPRGSFKSKKRRAHWNWLADLEQRSPQAAAYYRHTRQRKGAQRRWKSAQRQNRGYRQRSPVGGRNRSRLYTPEGKPKKYSRTGMTGGAPNFQSIFGTGYSTPMSQAMRLGRYRAINQALVGGRRGGGGGGNWHWDRNAGGPIWAPNQR